LKSGKIIFEVHSGIMERKNDDGWLQNLPFGPGEDNSNNFLNNFITVPLKNDHCSILKIFRQ